jgi:hypothetical protein
LTFPEYAQVRPLNIDFPDLDAKVSQSALRRSVLGAERQAAVRPVLGGGESVNSGAKPLTNMGRHRGTSLASNVFL